jgi:hypothetical protein
VITPEERNSIKNPNKPKNVVCLEVSVGRLPQEVLLEEFYRSECSETVQVGRVQVFEELLAVFSCSVLTFGVQQSSIVNREPRVRYKLVSESGFAMEAENTAVHYRTF